MAAVLGIILLASVFEIRQLVKSKEKKELVVYLVILACAVSLSIFLLLSPEYTSFSHAVLGLFHIKH